MADLITLVLVGMFGTVTILMVSFFILIRQQSRKSTSNTADYSKPYKQSDGYGNPFKKVSSQGTRGQPPFAVMNIAIIVIGIVVSIFFDPFVGLLIILALPFIIRFIRVRMEAIDNQNKVRDEGR